MTLLPPATIALALLAGMAIPLLVLLFSRVRLLRIAKPGRRYYAACVVAIICWLVMAGSLPGPIAAADMIAAVAVLLAASLSWFTLWTLLIWGVTLAMHVTVARAGGNITRQEWLRAFTQGEDLGRFALDRIGVLTMFGMATLAPNLRLTPRGRHVARLARLTRRWFGISA